MARRTGHADLPLHTGTVPRWLADRMRDMGTLIIESLLINSGKREVLRRLADPLWFQSLGAVLGMDWHSSGITTSVLYALKRGINPRAKEFGLCVCGGRGRYSRRTPEELAYLGERTGLDAPSLIRASRLCAKTDNTAVQDGFQLYQHNFILSDDGDWTVVQQGMNPAAKTARRYHWCSQNLKSFVEEPHSGVTGENRGPILNLTDKAACGTRSAVLSLTGESPERLMREIRAIARIAENGTLFPAEDGGTADTGSKSDGTDGCPPEHALPCGCGTRNLSMPARHNITVADIDLKRLGGVLTTAYEARPADFESLLLTPGLGARTIQSLCLVSEVIHGTPSRFRDPARFSFAHGGKDGHPFPVPTRIYDESIRILKDAIEKSRLGYTDKSACIRRLHETALQIEENCSPEADFAAVLEREKRNSAAWGGRTVADP